MMQAHTIDSNVHNDNNSRNEGCNVHIGPGADVHNTKVASRMHLEVKASLPMQLSSEQEEGAFGGTVSVQAMHVNTQGEKGSNLHNPSNDGGPDERNHLQLQLQDQGQQTPSHHHSIHDRESHHNTAQQLSVQAHNILQHHSISTTTTITATSSINYNSYPITTSTLSTVNSNVNSSQTFSLPPELKKILHEVARTGRCTSLPWTASGLSYSSSQANARRHLKHKRSAKKRRKQSHTAAVGSSSSGMASAAILNGMSPYSKALHSESLNTTAQHIVNNNGIDDSCTKASSVNSKSIPTVSSSACNQGSRVEKKEKMYYGVNMNENVDNQQVPPSASHNLHASLNKESIGSIHSIPNSHTDSCSVASQGSKRSADLSVSISTSTTADVKKRKFYRDNQSCASSCSESVSSAGGGSTISIPSSSASMGPLCLSLPFRTLRGALRLAVALVLEYSYKHRGGYKLSPAEKRRFEVLQNANNKLTKDRNSTTYYPSQTDFAFMERRMRLLKMLGGGKSGRSSSAARVVSNTSAYSGNASDGGLTSDTSIDSIARKRSSEDFSSHTYGPPFTIQRVAEVLLMPERYYVQTHKLCNALEKLLLVTSPSTAFGGVTGGDSSRREEREIAALADKNRREEKEIAALADKKERDESERLRSRKLKPMASDGSDPIIQMNVSVETPESKRLLSNSSQQGYSMTNDGINASNINGDHENRLASNPMISDGRILGAMVGDTDGPPASVNMVSSAVDNSYQHQHAIVQNQGLSARTDSFPPGSLAGAAVLQHAGALSRPPSPSLFSSNQGLNQLITSHQTPSHHHMQSHHHGGVLDAAACLRPGQNVQMEIVIDQTSGGGCPTTSSDRLVQAGGVYLDQVEQGRSSASNSDIDSESDDISFDDSASDRSDGSDFDPGLSEPFTAARVLALTRMQQQHRREQYLQDRALRQVAATSNFQPPSDSEYQSGDSGSDSSSSDVAD